MMDNQSKTMDKIVALLQGQRLCISAAREIYGGLANSWDYGPLGVEFKNNVKRAWWKKFVQESPYNVGLDSGHPDEPARSGSPPAMSAASTTR